ncbi:MAG: hypothetical protein GF347_04175 [Candidatus Moranbacteria bacterium]|nr:hypothetical protein [Candidatus Moranbacteria bacterium]
MLPNFIKPFLWSYDFSKIDLEKDKKVIILNILNLGSKQAINWLFDNYSRSEILEVINRSYSGEWNKKSLNYWSIVLDFNKDAILQNTRQRTVRGC